MGVAQAVKADGGDLRVLDDASERFVDGVGVYRFGVAVGEHPLLRVVDTDGSELG